MTAGGDGARVSQWVAWALAVLAALLAATAVALPLIGGHDYLRELMTTPEVVVAVSFSATGALLVRSDQARRIGWLLLAIGVLSGIYTAALSATAFALDGDVDAVLPAGAGWARITAWVTAWAWLPGYLMLATVLPAVVPFGRPLSRAWRVPLVLSGVAILLGVTVLALSPGQLGFFSGIDNPFAVGALRPVLDGLLGPLNVLLIALSVAAFASLVVRVVRADGTERRQVGWFGYAVALVIVATIFAPDLWVNIAVLAVPAGIAVAALRYRLYDLDLLVNRTLVAGLLLAGAALAYAALVAWVGSVFGTSGGVVPFVAAFAVALAFHPARLLVQRYVDRLFFGRRGDPYSLLQDLDRALREAASPRAALGSAVEVIRTGLRTSGAVVAVPVPGSGVTQEQAGSPVGESLTTPLMLHGEEVGRLMVGARQDAGRLSSTDIRVVEALAGPLASAAYALRLSGDLEESRRRLLTAREDERRRLRRDLHDGLGPQLAGVVMGVDVISSTLSRGNVEAAAELAATVGGQAKTAVEDVRRLVAGLRPPVLDDLGLLGALQASGPAAVTGGPTVRFHTSGELSGLPAAVEVAAYRIVSEALTNAARHSGATVVNVRLELGQEALEVTVQDDGIGLPATVSAGVGMVSMRERAAELGGWCTVTSGDATVSGTRVTAELPVGAS